MPETSRPRAKIPPIEPLVTYQPEWSPWIRQFMTVALVIAVVFGLVLLVPVLQILVTTFLLAFIMYVPARFLAERSTLRFRGAVVLVYLLLVVTVIAVVFLILPNVVNLLQSLPEGLRTLESRAAALLRATKPGSVIIPIINLDAEFFLAPLRSVLTPEVSGAIRDGVTPVTSVVTNAAESLPSVDLGEIVTVVTSLASGLVGAIVSFVSTGFLAVFLSLLILLDLPNYQASMFNVVPASYHRELRILLGRISLVWNGFFRGQVTIGFIIGVLTALQLAVMGAPSPVGLAVIVAIISLIPSIGGLFALVPLFIVPLISGSTVITGTSNVTFALLVVVVNLVWTQVIWNVVAPKIMGEAVSLPLPVIIIGIGIGAALGGILGAFLIVPIAGTLRILVIYMIAKINIRDPFPGENMPELIDLEEL